MRQGSPHISLTLHRRPFSATRPPKQPCPELSNMPEGTGCSAGTLLLVPVPSVADCNGGGGMCLSDRIPTPRWVNCVPYRPNPMPRAPRGVPHGSGPATLGWSRLLFPQVRKQAVQGCAADASRSHWDCTHACSKKPASPHQPMHHRVTGFSWERAENHGKDVCWDSNPGVDLTPTCHLPAGRPPTWPPTSPLLPLSGPHLLCRNPGRTKDRPGPRKPSSCEESSIPCCCTHLKTPAFSRQAGS